MGAYDWLEYNGVELVNSYRTVMLARAMGVDTVRIDPEKVSWIEDALPLYLGFGLGGFGEGEFGLGEKITQHYGDVSEAPWYDAAYAASAEFAGFVPLDVRGLDDSSTESTAIEYTGDGGFGGRPRNATQPIVVNFALIAQTERGAEYGKRWLDRTLKSAGSASRALYAGADLRYSRWSSPDAPIAHRQNVLLSRGTSITAKRKSACAATWLLTFTLTAGDPYEYGEPDLKIYGMGGSDPATGPGVTSYGSQTLVEVPCSEFDYSPLYDPMYPALVPPPAPPDFFPTGWTIASGDTFDRCWARITPTEPSSLNVVPVIQLHTTTEARMVRVCIWPNVSTPEEQCSPLFSAVVTYLPANTKFYIDGQRQAAYVWDGYSPNVRRTDSLLYSGDANPIEWTAFNDAAGLLVTLDVFATDGGGFEGNGDVRVGLSLVPKSD